MNRLPTIEARRAAWNTREAIVRFGTCQLPRLLEVRLSRILERARPRRMPQPPADEQRYRPHPAGYRRNAPAYGHASKES